ncbi:MATE efflux family protein [Moraxella macacae 0408225]|uniref:Multidrug-efflux transporter n=1 Tax=Moraxella macacae 0408225 TaxID=1230338 RepID=L2F793_9GAMM|nr:MATE family efflux transporter [Moraxella macacae]ELA08328.1 MATE efflux family protein [Moraxella macacae 0408225]
MQILKKPSKRQDLQQLFLLTLPILITQICQSGLGLIDTIMAGRVSALDLSGVAIGSGLWLPVMLLAVGVLLATTPLIGEVIGQNQREKIPFITQQSLWLAVLIGFIGIVIVNQMHHLFALMGVPDHIQPIAKEYLFGIGFGFPAVGLYTTLRCYTETLKHPTVVMIISVIGLVLNIPINYAFIYGIDWLGLPAFGGAGCGYASAVCLWLNLVMLIGYLSFSKHKDFSQYRFFKQFSLPKTVQLAKQLAIGIPIGCSIFFEVSAFSLASLIISPLGEIALASHQVTLSISSQLFMLPFSVAIALTILVSSRYGAKDYASLKQIKLLGVMVATSLALITMTFTAVFRTQLPKFFSDNPQVIDKASLLLYFALAYQLFDAWQVSFAGILRGLQDTSVPMFITLFCYWGVAIPLGAYLVRFTDMGAKGVWIGLVMALGLASILLGSRLLWQQKTLKTRWLL